MAGLIAIGADIVGLAMTTNDVLRRLRYALNITDLKLLEVFALANRPLKREELDSIFKKEEEPGYLECPDELAEAFFKGLIASRRGPREESADRAVPPRPAGVHLGNNEMLRYIRIALELRDDDIIAIMKLSNTIVSKAEVNALFRKHGHSNWRPCGDQFLRNFLLGLTSRYR